MMKTWWMSVGMGLLLLSWIAGGTYWYHTNISSMCASLSNGNDIAAEKVPIQDGEYVIDHTPPFRFVYGNHEPIFLSSAIHALKHTADYLQQSPDKVLNVTGWQQQTESKEANYLASLRANEVRDVLVDLGVNGDRILTAGQTNNAMSFSQNQTHEAIGFMFINRPPHEGQPNKTPSPTEKIKTANSVALSDANLYFPKNSANIYPKTVQKEVKQYMTQVAQALQKHTDWHVRIVGHADNSEEKEESLAQQRAISLGRYLVQLGAKQAQISVAQAGAVQPVGNVGSAKNRRVELRWQQNM